MSEVRKTSKETCSTLKHVHVWIASHIYAVQRHYWLLECLESLINQTLPPDEIYVSYSVERYVEDVVNCDYKSMFADVKFIRVDNRQEQFSHISDLVSIVDGEYDYTYKSNLYVMFCDDDDMYVSSRISTLIPYLTDGVKAIRDKFLCINESGNVLSVPNNNKHYDFGNHVVCFSLLHEFLQSNTHTEYKITHSRWYCFTDTIFMFYLANHSYVVEVDEKLYLKRFCHNIRMITKSWDKPLDYDFSIDAEKNGLTKRFVNS